MRLLFKWNQLDNRPCIGCHAFSSSRKTHVSSIRSSRINTAISALEKRPAASFPSGIEEKSLNRVRFSLYQPPLFWPALHPGRESASLPDLHAVSQVSRLTPGLKCLNPSLRKGSSCDIVYICTISSQVRRTVTHHFCLVAWRLFHVAVEMILLNQSDTDSRSNRGMPRAKNAHW